MELKTQDDVNALEVGDCFVSYWRKRDTDDPFIIFCIREVVAKYAGYVVCTSYPWVGKKKETSAFCIEKDNKHLDFKYVKDNSIARFIITRRKTEELLQKEESHVESD